MNLRQTIPSQVNIEEFLGRDFFSNYPNAQTVKETIDMVQLQFQISDEARDLKAAKAHGTDGTILESLVLFAMQRLVEKNCLIHVGKSTYKWKSGVRYYGRCPMKDVNYCIYRLTEMTKVHIPMERAVTVLNSICNPETVAAAVHKFQLTNPENVIA